LQDLMTHVFTKFIFVLLMAILLPGLSVAKDNSYQSLDAKFKSQLKHAQSYRVAVQKKVKKKRYKKRLSSKQRRLSRERKISRIINQDHFNANGHLSVSSKKALVMNQITGEVIYGKNSRQVTPIASVTKLMTAMVALDAGLPMGDYLVIGAEDIDNLKKTRSRLKVGTALQRSELLQLALMSSENRAAAAISRYYPGGRPAFIRAMNVKAAMLGMQDTRFYDSSGLDSRNVSTAMDLAKMVNAAHQYDEIRQYTTTPDGYFYANNRTNPLKYVNTNLLVRQNNSWFIGVSKTGYIHEAGRCLVMQADIDGEPMIMVLLDSKGKYTRLGDANRVRKWYEHNRESRLSMLDSGTEYITVQ